MRRLLTTLAALLTVLGAPTTTAYAAEEAPTPAAWEVLPAPDDDGPRQAFELELEPGQSHQDAVLVRNRGAEPITVDVWATDAVTTPSGDLGLLLAEDTPRFAGAWITVGSEQVTIEPRGEVTVPFSLAVPANEQPGDYVAGVVVSMPREETTTAGEVVVEARVASRVYLRVPGELAPALAVSELSLHREAPWWNFWSGRSRLDFTVTNTGNARLLPQSSATLTGPFGVSVDEHPGVALPELMPGDSMRASALAVPEVAQSLTSEPVPAWGRITAEVSVLGRLSVGPEAVRQSAEVSVLAVPWIPAGLVLLLAAVVSVRVVRAVRRRRAAGRGGGAGASGAGDRPSVAAGAEVG